MSGSPMGYSGFESPMEQYYGTSPSLPVLYTGAMQIRQVGVGATTTNGPAVPSVISALANPSANMVTANGAVLKAQVYTAADIFNYYPNSTANPNA